MIHGENLPEIPSEFIEPYFRQYMMMKLEALHFRLITPEQVRTTLKEINGFAGAFTGLHCSIATNNEYYKIINMSDESMIEIADQVFK